MEEKEVIFAQGLNFPKETPNFPDFVRTKFGINKQSFINWLNTQQGEWINVEVKVAKSGRHYMCIDDYKPSTENPRYGTQPSHDAEVQDFRKDPEDEIPF